MKKPMYDTVYPDDLLLEEYPQEAESNVKNVERSSFKLKHKIKQLVQEIGNAISLSRGTLALGIIKCLTSNGIFKNHVYIRNAEGKAIWKGQTMYEDAAQHQQTNGGLLDAQGKGDNSKVIPGRERTRKYHIDELPQLAQWGIGKLGGTPNEVVQSRLMKIADVLGTSYGFSYSKEQKQVVFDILKVFGIRPWDERNWIQYDASFPEQKPLYPFAKTLRKGLVGAHYFFNGDFEYKLGNKSSIKLNYVQIMETVAGLKHNGDIAVNKDYSIEKRGQEFFLIIPVEQEDAVYETVLDIESRKKISLKRHGENFYRQLVESHGEWTADVIGLYEVLIRNKLIRGHWSK